MFRSYIPAVIRSIDKIETKLHRIQLSGNYSYSMIKQKIGKLKVDENYKPEERKKNYRKRAFRQMKDGTILLVYYDPVYLFGPWSLIEFSYPKKDNWKSLMKLFQV